MKIFCTMIGIILTKVFTLTTTHQSLHSKWVNFVEYELYLKKMLKVSKHIYTHRKYLRKMKRIVRELEPALFCL